MFCKWIMILLSDDLLKEKDASVALSDGLVVMELSHYLTLQAVLGTMDQLKEVTVSLIKSFGKNFISILWKNLIEN